MNKLITNQNELSSAAREYIRDSLSANTRRGYAADLRDWSMWCELNQVNSNRPTGMQTANYLAFLAKAGVKHSTLARRRAAIRRALRVAAVARADSGFVDPTDDPHVRAVLQGAARTHGVTAYRKQALTIGDLQRVVAAMDDSIASDRDRAMMCIQFACAQRGGELLALTVKDIKIDDDEMTVRIARSKTDQAGKGETITVPRTGGATCPVSAYEKWIGVSGIARGPVFRRIYKNATVGTDRLTHKALSGIVKARTAAAGLVGDYSGHSARRGFVTSATDRGLSDAQIMRITRHRSVQSMHEYRQVDGGRQRDTISAVFGG
jgi:integrase